MPPTAGAGRGAGPSRVGRRHDRPAPDIADISSPCGAIAAAAAWPPPGSASPGGRCAVYIIHAPHRVRSCSPDRSPRLSAHTVVCSSLRAGNWHRRPVSRRSRKAGFGVLGGSSLNIPISTTHRSLIACRTTSDLKSTSLNITSSALLPHQEMHRFWTAYEAFVTECVSTAIQA